MFMNQDSSVSKGTLLVYRSNRRIMTGSRGKGSFLFATTSSPAVGFTLNSNPTGADVLSAEYSSQSRADHWRMCDAGLQNVRCFMYLSHTHVRGLLFGYITRETDKISRDYTTDFSSEIPASNLSSKNC